MIMPVLQTAYFIEDDLYKKVLSGELQQFGTVIRDGGKIVKHLKEVPVPKQGKEVAQKAVKKQGNAVWQVVKDNKAELLHMLSILKRKKRNYKKKKISRLLKRL